MAIKKNDFIEIEYTGIVTEAKAVFDTTDEKIAKDCGIYSKKTAYGPLIVCVGENQLIPGLDKEIPGKEAGKEYTVSLKAEDAFGKKDIKLLKMIPVNVFKKQEINPMPGLEVNIDGAYGLIKNVSGGRTVVDFNHPLAGKDITYKVKINRLITNANQKLQSFLSMGLGVKSEAIKSSFDGQKMTVVLPMALPKEATDGLSEKLKEVIPEIKEIVFTAEPKEAKGPKAEAEKKSEPTQ